MVSFRKGAADLCVVGWCWAERSSSRSSSTDLIDLDRAVNLPDKPVTGEEANRPGEEEYKGRHDQRVSKVQNC